MLIDDAIDFDKDATMKVAVLKHVGTHSSGLMLIQCLSSKPRGI